MDKQNSYPPEMHAKLFELEARHFWFSHRNEIILRVLSRHVHAAKSFCEVGCGTGIVLAAIARAFPGLTLTGCELYAQALEFAGSRLSNIRLVEADILDFPYQDEFDMLGVFDVLEHVDDVAALRNLHSALRPGGILVVTVPQHRWLWSAADEYSCHKRRYVRKELHEKLQAASFTPMETFSFVTLLLPVMYVVRRLLSKNVPAEYDAVKELSLPGVVNQAFGAVCAVERMALALGLKPSVGGSLLCVARKNGK